MSCLRLHVNVANLPPRAGRAAARRAELKDLLTRATRATLAAHDIVHAELSLTLLGDPAIADLNTRFLDHPGPTDVIAFPLHAAGEAPLGDVYLGYPQALRQAARLGVSADEELARLAIHGTLHVLGYEHPDGADRESSPMWHVQERVLREVMPT